VVRHGARIRLARGQKDLAQWNEPDQLAKSAGRTGKASSVPSSTGDHQADKGNLGSLT